MKARWILGLVSIAVTLGGTELFARAAVARNVAGALLAPGGSLEALDLMVAIGFLLFRVGSVASTCGVTMMIAWDLARAALERVDRSPDPR